MKQADSRWFTEQQTPNLRMSWRIKRTIEQQQTPYQRLEVVETEQYGKMLILDGMVMTTEADEFAYHELLTHIPMSTHPCPRRVLIIGGGDGGAVREVLRHSEVKQVTLVELDQAVIEAAKRHFPQISKGFADPRVQVVIKDGDAFVRQQKQAYDVVIVDSTEPIGPGKALFQTPFYAAVYQALTDQGIMVAQTESPWVNRSLIRTVFQRIAAQFPLARLYYGAVPTYPSGLWTYTMGSKAIDPLTNESAERKRITGTKYYHPRLYSAVFRLPPFMKELLIE